MQQNKLNQHDEQTLDARIAAANQFGKMIDKLKQTQDKLNQNVAGMEKELWDKILDSPNQMFRTLKQNKFPMNIGNSAEEMIRNRVKSLEADKGADILGVLKNIKALREVSDQQLTTNDGVARHASLLQDAQQGLDKANEAWQMEIAIKRKLADAEKNANNEAVKLANQLNEGFKSTAQQGVLANTMEAFALQARTWDTQIQPELQHKQAGCGRQGAVANDPIQPEDIHRAYSRRQGVIRRPACGRQGT